MYWIASERTGLVHSEDCEYGQAITFGRVEYEELYHALYDGYEEAGCCLTDRPMVEINISNKMKKQSRQRVIGENGCAVCGESRCTQLAHVTPRSIGGSVMLPMCPTHHKAYDEGCLTEDELSSLSEAAWTRISPQAGGEIYRMHGAVRKIREGHVLSV